LTADNIDREHELRAVLPSAAAAGRSSLRSTENHQIQNNKRQSSGDVSCLLTYYLLTAVAFEGLFISVIHCYF